jgi:hypothetical protein
VTHRSLASATRRHEHNLAQIRDAPTKAVRLRKVCMWLVAEALRKRNTHRLTETTNAVLDLLYRLQKNLPLPEPVHGSPTADDLITPRAPHWHTRGATPDRREVAS